MYIEQVRFTEPYNLQLIGGDDERLETFLAQRGIRSEDELRDANRTDFFPRDRPITTPFPPLIGEPGAYDVLYPCGQIPIGGIIMWSGPIADIDTECWALCDGTAPTPDLRDRFIVGAGGALAVGDTGGEDTSDLSHTHGDGTLVADNESAHTHGIGSYAAANESSHTHGDGSYAAANDTHNHDHGNLHADVDLHQHSVVGVTVGVSDSNVVVATGSDHTVARGSHSHSLGGDVDAGLGHDHNTDSGTVANDTHNHSVSGTSGTGSAHNHSVSGTSGTGSAHGHTISGNTATGGLVAHENRPQFYALAFIMRIA